LDFYNNICQEQTHAPQQTIRIDFDLIDPNQHADSAPRQEFPIGSITIASDQSAQPILREEALTQA
jgi:hypothetical protein